nr:unnamed protein product [Callosobruchus analis]
MLQIKSGIKSPEQYIEIIQKWGKVYKLGDDAPVFDWKSKYTKEQTILYPTIYTKRCVTVEELKVFFAILLISGYSKRPGKHMYWIARGMSRNKFRDILRDLHFVNNGQLPPGDKFAKVRPLIDHLNSIFLKYIPLTQNTSISVDESIVPYYSHHIYKQRIQGKSIRYGFTFWSENVSNGYLVNTEPYQGKGTFLGDSDLGLGASVVSTFANRLKEKFPDQKFNFFIDNFFTALECGCAGTIRPNRIEKCPL